MSGQELVEALRAVRADRERHVKNLDLALAVDRSRWQVGLEAWGPLRELDRFVLWTVVEVDWNRGAGPIICEFFDEENGGTFMSLMQPWELTPDEDIPRTLDQVYDFLGL